MRGPLKAALLLAPALTSALAVPVPEGDEFSGGVERRPVTEDHSFALVSVEVPKDSRSPDDWSSQVLGFRIDVLKSEEACGYGNITIDGQVLPQTLEGNVMTGKGPLSTDRMSVIGASWEFHCIKVNGQPDAQLLKFAVDFFDGKAIQDVGFSVSFKQTGATEIINIETDLSVPDNVVANPNPEGLQPVGENVDFPQYNVQEDIEELNWMRAQLKELHLLIAEKEQLIAEHMSGNFDEDIKDCDSLRCVMKAVADKARKAASTLYGKLSWDEEQFGERKHHSKSPHKKKPKKDPFHHEPKGNHTHGSPKHGKGNHTHTGPPHRRPHHGHRPLPICRYPSPPHHHQGPPHHGPPHGPPHHGPHGKPPGGPHGDHRPDFDHHDPEHKGPPHHDKEDGPHRGPENDGPREHEHEHNGPSHHEHENEHNGPPHREHENEHNGPPHHEDEHGPEGHEGPHGPENDDGPHGPPHHGGPPHGMQQEHMGPPPGEGPHHGGPPGDFHGGPPHGKGGLLQVVKFTAIGFLVAFLFLALHRRCCTPAHRRSRKERRQERRRRRAYRRAAKQSGFSRFFSRFWGDASDDESDDYEEKREALLANESTTMTEEISQFRNVSDIVEDIVAAEEGRSQTSEVPLIAESESSIEMRDFDVGSQLGEGEQLPAYEDNDGSEDGNFVADGFRYTPGSSDYSPAHSAAGSVSDILGPDTKQ